MHESGPVYIFITLYMFNNVLFSSNRVHILLSEKTEVHLPVCEINPTRNLHSTLKKFMTVSCICYSIWELWILFLLTH
jgi:hypothetical protein